MGPLTQAKPWNMESVEGVHRFLNRVWRMIVAEETETRSPAIVETPPSTEQLRLLHETIRKVTFDIESLSFNTAIAAMMTFVNEAARWEQRPISVLRTFVLLLSPFAPHLAEELWEKLDGKGSLAHEPWPSYDPALLVRETVEYAVQVNGKVRGRFVAPADADQGELEKRAREEPNVARWLEGKAIRKVIIVPGRLVNFIVGG